MYFKFTLHNTGDHQTVSGTVSTSKRLWNLWVWKVQPMQKRLKPALFQMASRRANPEVLKRRLHREFQQISAWYHHPLLLWLTRNAEIAELRTIGFDTTFVWPVFLDKKNAKYASVFQQLKTLWLAQIFVREEKNITSWFQLLTVTQTRRHVPCGLSALCSSSDTIRYILPPPPPPPLTDNNTHILGPKISVASVLKRYHDPQKFTTQAMHFP